MAEAAADHVEEVVEVQLTLTEQEAQAEGWQTKDEWVTSGKAEDEWRPAREFKERGELFRKIEALSTDLKSTRSTLTALKGHYEKVKETEFNRALETLKAEKKAAFEAGNADAIIEIDEKIADVKETQKKQAQVDSVQTPTVPPEFTEWLGQNVWYSTNTEMQAFADSIGRSYALQRPGVQPAEVLKYVSSKVKTAFPEKFTNPKRSEPSSVEAGKGPRSKVDTFQLSPEEERTMNQLVKQKVMTKEEYIKSIKDLGDR